MSQIKTTKENTRSVKTLWYKSKFLKHILEKKMLITASLLIILVLIISLIYQNWWLPKLSMESYNKNTELHNASISNYPEIADFLVKNISEGDFIQADSQNITSKKEQLQNLIDKTTQNIDKIDNKGNSDSQNFSNNVRQTLQIYKQNYNLLLNILDFQICNINFQKENETQNAKIKLVNYDNINNQDKDKIVEDYKNISTTFSKLATNLTTFRNNCLPLIPWQNTTEIQTNGQNLAQTYTQYANSISQVIDAYVKEEETALNQIKTKIQEPDFETKFDAFLTSENNLRVSIFETLKKINTEINFNNQKIIVSANEFKKKYKP